MKVIDLSHPVSPGMPVYPGTEPPVFVTGASIAQARFLEKKITLFSHTGTHIDAPAHLIEGASTLDQFPVDHFISKAVVVGLEGCKGPVIGIKDLERFADAVEEAAFVLIRTGWSRYWGTDRYFQRFPVLSLEAARWLADFDLNGVGFDTISPDPMDTEDYPVHKAFLERDTIVVENLTRLDRLPDVPFMFSCLPISFEDADGSPVRAVGLVVE
jgi:kynurenine formamidase